MTKIDNNVTPVAIAYLIHSGIRTFFEAAAAMSLVRRSAVAAQANSVASIPSPATSTSSPGPGRKNIKTPATVITPPTTPIDTRQIKDP